MSGAVKDGRLSRYKMKKQIGKGSYGTVFLVECKDSKKNYVMKDIDLALATDKNRLAAEQEANLLSQLHHPNIVSYRESFQDVHGVLHIVMGYCERGDLSSRLKTYGCQLLPESQVVEWFVQIALALQYLHERNILHRDLKTQNIFLSKSDIVKVGDLGIARVLDGTCDLAHTIIGTPYYMSPELFANQPYNQKSDVWALGCCVYEMASLKHAFTARTIESLMCKVVQGKVPPLPADYSPELVNLVHMMLAQQASHRPSVQQILHNQYIRTHIRGFIKRTAARKRKGKSRAVKTRTVGQPQVPVARDTVDGIQIEESNEASSFHLHGRNHSHHHNPSEVVLHQPEHPHCADAGSNHSSSNGSSNNSSSSGGSAIRTEAVCTDLKTASEDQERREELVPHPSSSSLDDYVKKSIGGVSSARMRRRRSRRKLDSDQDTAALESYSSSDLMADGRVGVADGGMDMADGRVGVADGGMDMADDIVDIAREVASCASVDGSVRDRSDNGGCGSGSETDLIGQDNLGVEQQQQQQQCDEVDDLFTLLDDTLKQGDQEVPSEAASATGSNEDGAPGSSRQHSSGSLSSPHPLLTSGRLADRTRALRQECEALLGQPMVDQVLHMLRNNSIETEDVEEHLKLHTSESSLSLHLAKLQQLQLCEDSLKNATHRDCS